jgi:hypothetical protein
MPSRIKPVDFLNSRVSDSPFEIRFNISFAKSIILFPFRKTLQPLPLQHPSLSQHEGQFRPFVHPRTLARLGSPSASAELRDAGRGESVAGRSDFQLLTSVLRPFLFPNHQIFYPFSQLSFDVDQAQSRFLQHFYLPDIETCSH